MLFAIHSSEEEGLLQVLSNAEEQCANMDCLLAIYGAISWHRFHIKKMWICEFWGKKVNCEYEDHFCTWMMLTSGVPQGSMLHPKMFLISMILNQYSSLFADNSRQFLSFFDELSNSVWLRYSLLLVEKQAVGKSCWKLFCFGLWIRLSEKGL